MADATETLLARLIEEVERVGKKQDEMSKQLSDMNGRFETRAAAEAWRQEFYRHLGGHEHLGKRVATLEAKVERSENHRVAVLAVVGSVISLITAAGALVAAL